MKWKKRFTKLKAGDIVRFKSPNSYNAAFFKKGLTGLQIDKEISHGSEYHFNVYERDKSTSWYVNRDEIELDD